jgi:addiction module HigA family antidote
MIVSFANKETEKVYRQIFKELIKMSNRIPTPSIGEILKEEFMDPLGISAYKLAQEIHVPVSRIQEILHNRRKITADTSLRLAKYFGVSDKYFLDLQNDIDIRRLKEVHKDELNSISTCRLSAVE